MLKLHNILFFVIFIFGRIKCLQRIYKMFRNYPFLHKIIICNPSSFPCHPERSEGSYEFILKIAS